MIIKGTFDRLARWSGPLIKPFEEKKIHYHALRKEGYQPIFIVGAPRTGSTLLCQILSNTFDFLYIDNLIATFYRNLYFGFWLSDQIFHQKPHNCFNSIYGGTKSYGLRGPSESGNFWYQWLPRDKQYMGRGETPEKTIREIREIVFAVMNRYKKPLLIKNLNTDQRMGLIFEIAPNAKFIFIKRDPLFTAQSIFICRKRLGIREEEWWSIKPKEYEQLSHLGYHSRIVKQIYFLERQIMKDSRLFPKENFVIIDYKELCLNTEKIITDSYKFIGRDIRKRQNAITPRIRFQEEKRIDDEDFEKLEKEISKLNWLHYDLT